MYGELQVSSAYDAPAKNTHTRAARAATRTLRRIWGRAMGLSFPGERGGIRRKSMAAYGLTDEQSRWRRTGRHRRGPGVLRLVQLLVEAAGREQLVVAASLHDPAPVEYQDLVGRGDGRQS